MINPYHALPATAPARWWPLSAPTCRVSAALPPSRAICTRAWTRCAATVVMVNMAALILAEDYGLAESVPGGPFIMPPKLHTIPHGVPRVEMPRRSYNFKRALHEENLLATFGLISSGKGLEYVVKAMPQIIEQHPNTAYLILGE